MTFFSIFGSHKKIRSRLIIVSLVVCLIGMSLFPVYKIFRWRAYIWLPDYILQRIDRKTPSLKDLQEPGHIIFLVADHYEPGYGDDGIKKNLKWIKRYRQLADRHLDSYGRKLQHTWFYAYDLRDETIMKDLSRMVFEGYGEIEFHWHHGPDTNDSFRVKLRDAVTWYGSFGAMKAIGGSTGPRFGFVHGNWALDNSGKEKHCGVSRELHILGEAGCYADFTFPSLGNVSQPRKVNAIYWARDTDGNKSYTVGTDVAVGKRGTGIIIFEGPLSVSFDKRLFDCDAVEMDYQPSTKRLDRWIDERIGIKGMPEWIFVKIHTHGMQGREVFFGSLMDEMLDHLESEYIADGYRIHYVTAREAYNMIRAAEDGFVGDPDQVRNYEIDEPVNRWVLVDAPVSFHRVSRDEIEITSTSPELSKSLFLISPVQRVEGRFNYFSFRIVNGEYYCTIRGNGQIKILSKKRLQIHPEGEENKMAEGYQYLINETNKYTDARDQTLPVEEKN